MSEYDYDWLEAECQNCGAIVRTLVSETRYVSRCSSCSPTLNKAEGASIGERLAAAQAEARERLAALEAENERLRAALERQKAAALRWFYEEFDDEKLQEMEDAGIIAQAEGFSLGCVVQLKMDMEEALAAGGGGE